MVNIAFEFWVVNVYDSSRMVVPSLADSLKAPWGGHSVFPNIYRDMRHPVKYTRAINYTYIFTVSENFLHRGQN